MNPDLLLAPPPELNGLSEGQARWRSLYPLLALRGPVDQSLLLAYCQVWDRWRNAENAIARAGPLVKTSRGAVTNPLITVSNTAATQARSLERLMRLDELETDLVPEPATTAAAPPATGPLCTRRELAERLDTHMQTICKWERQGMPIAERGARGRPSKYDETRVRLWLAERKAKSQENGGVDAIASRAARESAQAKLAEQTYMARARLLLPVEEVEKVWNAEVTAVRSRLQALPVSYAAQLHRAAVLEGEAGVEAVLEKMVRDVLTELSKPVKPAKIAPAEPRRRKRSA